MSIFSNCATNETKETVLGLIFFIERRGLPNVTVETKNNNSNVVKLVEGPDDVL